MLLKPRLAPTLGSTTTSPSEMFLLEDENSNVTSILAANNATTSTPSTQCSISTLHLDYDPVTEFHSLQYALFICVFVEVLGALCFFITSLYLVSDKQKAERVIAGKLKINHEFSSCTLQLQSYRHFII